ncbi:hypothetical protein [Clostridium akagii]|uniref:hypothetical protein n=1 Tax=Clostridium akagii TaxID=91623 RepID=UPI00047C727C|nr:hypothetical protein [Clostridium akagii]
MEEALYKQNNIEININAKNLTRVLYFSKYKSHLYCKEKDCSAELNFVDGKNGSKFFRTNASTNHKFGCPSEVGHNERTIENKKKQYENRINITNKHMNNTLERAFNKFINDSIDKGDGIHKKKYSNPQSVKGNNGNYSPELFNDGVDSIVRGPNISTIIYSNIEKNDEGEIRCVIGYVNNMQLMERHGYMNLTPKMENSVKVHFAEYFVVNNESEFYNMTIVNKYIKLMKSKEEKVVCCCIGRIKYAKIGINIILDRYQGFILNGMGFYQILSYMRK